jgi:hypothetical protein
MSLDPLVRVVTFIPRPGQEDALLRLLEGEVVETNRRFGASSVWSLRGEPDMAIVSVWARAEDLEAMRADEGYQSLLGRIRDLSEDLRDQRFRLVAGSPA